jgi:anti-sigma regulatory factor (Ser/Thr protein kinase)
VAAQTIGACDEDVRLVTSELVTNAVVHARAPLAVSVACTGKLVLIEVTDGSKEFGPVTRSGWWRAIFGRQHRSDHHGGFGLALVQAVALRWGWEATREGKTVWAILRTRRYAPGSLCRCFRWFRDPGIDTVDTGTSIVLSTEPRADSDPKRQLRPQRRKQTPLWMMTNSLTAGPGYVRSRASRLRRSSSRFEYAAARIASSDSRPVPRPPPTVAADATNQASTNRSP